MTKVRKFLVARTQEELIAQLTSHLSASWSEVGSPVVSSAGLPGFNQYRQVIEKEMPERSFLLKRPASVR
jgi:hypothetical protein